MRWPIRILTALYVWTRGKKYSACCFRRFTYLDNKKCTNSCTCFPPIPIKFPAIKKLLIRPLIRIICTMSHLFSSVICLLPVCRCWHLCTIWHIFSFLLLRSRWVFNILSNVRNVSNLKKKLLQISHPKSSFTCALTLTKYELNISVTIV